jgi:hypothetical protein
MRLRTFGLLAASVALAVACGALAGGSDDAPAAPPPDAEVPDAAPAPEEDAADAGQDADAAPCGTADPQTAVVAMPEADGLIAVNSTQPFGGLHVCNMSVGRCLFRFAPGTAALDAFAARKVVSMTLTVQRADTDTACSNDCKPLRDNGTLTAYAARTDWNESQMTWYVRQTGAGGSWGAAGASAVDVDVGLLAATRDTAATELSVAIDLDPRAWTSTGMPLDGGKVGVLTEFFKAGGTRGQFVVVAHEPGAIPATPAKLSITYCP